MSGWLLAQGDARRLPLADRCVQCVATSPPYFGLRDYGVVGQIGLEPTPEAFVAAMVAVFREIRRVLRDDGVLWLNLGDSYNAHPGQRKATDLAGEKQRSNRGSPGVPSRNVEALKPKDLIGIPWRVALALQADGWYLRSDIIWSKPNPMPESVTDRPTKSHEYVFLLTKSERYFYDAEAVSEPATYAGKTVSLGPKSLSRGQAVGMGVVASGNGSAASVVVADGRNLRSVWSIATQPYEGAHFATMPPALAERCVKAGSSERGCCPACRTPWMREVESERVPTRPGVSSKVYAEPPVHPGSPMRRHAGDVCGNRDPQRHVSRKVTKGWVQACRCPAADPVPCLILDPFNGSGTTGAVAQQLGRRYVGVDLSRSYLGMAVDRIKGALRPRSRLDAAPAIVPLAGQLSLFAEADAS